MSTFLTRAIPLRIQPLTKQDELVTLLTVSHGKIRALVRGGQKIQSKLSNRFNLLQELDVMIAPGRRLDIVAGVSTRQMFDVFEKDLSRRVLALTLLDVINTVSIENEYDQLIYDFTIFWLHVFANEDVDLDAPFCALVLWRLLKFIGLSPDLSKKKLSYKNFLQSILQQKSEVDTLSFLLKTQEEKYVPAARYALHQVQHLLECEVRGLRILASL